MQKSINFTPLRGPSTQISARRLLQNSGFEDALHAAGCGESFAA